MNKKHRVTKQKETILMILQNGQEHPNADRIYEEARKTLPHISKGTVYRNLAILLEERLVNELNLNGTVTRYEIASQPHYHFRCLNCQQVIDLKLPVDTDLNNQVERATGFVVSNHQLEFRGICRECQTRSK